MKPNKVFFLAASLCLALSASARADGRHGNGGSTAVAAAPAPARGAGPVVHSGTGGFRYGGGPMISPSQRFSTFRGPMSGQRRFSPGPVTGTYNPTRFANARSRNFATVRSNQFNSGNKNHFNSDGNRNGSLNRNRNGNRAGLDNGNNHGNRVGNANNANNNHVFAKHSANSHPNWDKHHDHWWNGHHCHWANNSWIIYDVGFYPWIGYPYYDYYPYDYSYPYGYGYGYGDGGNYEYGYGNDPGTYDGGNQYDDKQGPGPYDDSYNNQNNDATVADIQQRLARQGYYHGQIDGVLGPDTQRALINYQRRNGLRVTGSLTPETLQSLNLRSGPGAN
jgi:Putative peptidoglycan binding domain